MKRTVVALIFAVLVLAVPAAATHESFSYDPPPEQGNVSYDAPAVDVPFTVDPPAENGSVSYDAPVVQVPFTAVTPNICVHPSLKYGKCLNPPDVSGTVSYDAPPVEVFFTVDPGATSGIVVYDAPPVDVTYTHDPLPRAVAIPHDPPPPPPPPLPACSNTVDDDGDGLIDFPADPGCASLIDDDEFNAPPPSDLCLVSNRLAWNLAGTNCAAATTINFTNEQFVCTGPLSAYGTLPLRLVWSFSGNPDFGDQGHLSFRAGCRGDGNDDTIDVIVASNANGLTVGAAGGAAKFQTAGPTDIQITGNFDCGPLGSSLAHQDTWQFHPNWPVARLDIVNGTSGDWDAGTSTCIGAGGAIFFSNPYDVDVYGGRYVTCNHGYFGNSTPSNQVVDAGFRTGRVDGSDPKCVGINAGAPTSGAATFTNVIAQRWNGAGWTDQ